MNRTERFYRIDQLLHERGVVRIDTFLDELGTSLASFKRDLAYLRERLHAPIIWDIEQRGYRFETYSGIGPRYELPGLWFNAQEIFALLTMRQLLSNLQPGLLAPHIEPLLARLTAVLAESSAPEEIDRRIRIIRATARNVEPRHFEVIASGLMQRRRLAIDYYNRSRDDNTPRTVSPQRLTHYRDNWYLDAWCHLRGGLRSFSLDAITRVALLAEVAKDVPEAELDEVLSAGYGIFSGADIQWASLNFTAERARWVAAEAWHPEQRGSFQSDGSYLLEIPYSDDRELIGDILRAGPEVEVISPPALRERVAEQLALSLRRYRR